MIWWFWFWSLFWFATGVVLFILVLHDTQARKEAHKRYEEFKRLFPGRCMVCSFHEYSRGRGYVPLNSFPDPHRCEERLAKMRSGF